MLSRSVLYPRTHNEKIQRVKIFNRDPRLPQRADKIGWRLGYANSMARRTSASPGAANLANSVCDQSE